MSCFFFLLEEEKKEKKAKEVPICIFWEFFFYTSEKKRMSVVLENYYDANYEPSTSEVEEYGKWLGMELPADEALLWIAKQGLKAPLPENWKACKSEKGELYYFNFKSGQSIWDHPMDEHYKEMLKREREKKKNEQRAQPSEPLPVQKEDEPKAQDVPEPATQQPPQHKSKLAQLKTLKKKSSPTPQQEKEPLAQQRPKAEEASSPSSASSSGTQESTVKQEAATPQGKPQSRSSSAPAAKRDLSPIPLAAKLSPIVRTDSGNVQPATSIPPPTHNEKAALELASFREQQDAETQRQKDSIVQTLAEQLKTTRTQLQQAHDAKLTKLKHDHEEQLKKDFDTFKKLAREKYDKSCAKVDAQLKDQLDLYTKTKEMEAARSGDLHQLCMDFERDLECHRQTFIEMLTNNETAKLQANSNANIEQTRLQCQKDIAAEKQAALERVATFREEYTKRYNEEVIASEKRIAGEKQRALDEVEGIHSAHATALRQLQAEHKTELDSTRGRLQDALQAVKSQTESECRKAEEEGAQKISELQAKIVEEYRTREAALRMAMEAELQDKALSVNRPPSAAAGPATTEASPYEEAPQRSPERHVQHIPHQPLKQTAPPPPETLRALVVSVFNDMLSSQQNSEKEGADAVDAPSKVDSNVGRASNDFVKDAACSPGLPTKVALTNITNTYNRIGQHSMDDQHRIIEQDQQRLHEARLFVDHQRAVLQERRQTLKLARSNWKRDVLEAKARGATCHSRTAEILRSVHAMLDKQAAGLDGDEALLQESEAWIATKEEALAKLKEEVDRHCHADCTNGGDASFLSVDTQVLLAPLQPNSATTETLALVKQAPAQPQVANSAASSRSNSPQLAVALGRIEARLNEVASLMRTDAPKAEANGAPTSAHHAKHQSAHRSHSRGARHASTHHATVGFVDYPTSIEPQRRPSWL